LGNAGYVALDTVSAIIPYLPASSAAIKGGTAVSHRVGALADTTSAGKKTAKVKKGKGGTRTKVTSNLGKEIDITPSSNHSTVSKNPGPKGTSNSSVDTLDDAGNVVTRRWYDSKGKAYRDVDMTNHGNSKTHPEYPHEHTWNWSGGKPIRSK